MYVDTNIFVDLLRGQEESREYLEKYLKSIKISVIVKLELIDGLESKREISKLNKIFDSFSIEVVQVNEKISKKAEDIFTNFRHSHGVSVNDVLIAATAMVQGKKLATHNTKHFSFIPGLKLIKPY